MGRMKSIGTITKNLKTALLGYNNGQNINQYEKYIYLTLFYRYLSENLVSYVKTNFNKNYIELSNDEAETYRKQIQEEKDYFILPEDLFQNVVKKELKSSRLDAVLNSVFANIKKSSKYDICDIFKNIDTEAESIGSSQSNRSQIYSNILGAIANIDFDFEKSEFDLFGNVFEFLLNNNDTNNQMSLSNGIFYTQPSITKLLREISNLYVKNPKNVYDPTCGSGSLLSEYARYNNNTTFYGQELNEIPSILCRMNMILHNVKDYHITNADTLLTYDPDEKDKYDLILANPPFGIKWKRKAIRDNDERFKDKPAPPENYADYAFIYHIIYTLSQDGIALVIDTPNMLKRKNLEEIEVKKHLIDSNVIDAIILLPAKAFLRTDTGTCLFVIRKNKKDKDILFIDASQIYTEVKKVRTFTDTNINDIIELLLDRKNLQGIAYLAKPEEIIKKEYSLHISDYIDYGKQKSATSIKKAQLTDFIYQNQEETNYKLRKQFNDNIIKANKVISNMLDKLEQEDKISLIPLNILVDIRSGAKLENLKIETNDSFPCRYITSKEMQDGSVVMDNTIHYAGYNISNSKRIRKEDTDKFIKKTNLENDDVLFTLCSGATKAAIVYNPDYIYCDTVFCLKIKEEAKKILTPAYLRYALESDVFKREVYARLNYNSNVPYIRIEVLRKLMIPLIPFDQQVELCFMLSLLEKQYKELELALEAEKEIYNYRYHSCTDKTFNSVLK